MTELQFQIVESVGFVAALALAFAIQRARPHRALRGSWRTNVPLWAVNAVVLTWCAAAVRARLRCGRASAA